MEKYKKDILESLIKKHEEVKGYKKIIEKGVEGDFEKKLEFLIYKEEYSYLLNDLFFSLKFVVGDFILSVEDLGEELKELFESMNKNAYKRVFALSQDGLQEVRKGVVKEKIEKIENNPNIEMIRKMLEENLNG